MRYVCVQGLGTAEQRAHGDALAQLLVHPRSRWMAEVLRARHDASDQEDRGTDLDGASAEPGPEEDFKALAQAADYSHQSHNANPEVGSQAKTSIEMDRNAASAEVGYRTALAKLLLDVELSEAKGDLLIGAPADNKEFGWVWNTAEPPAVLTSA